MKFGKDLKKQKVPEWTEAYVDYNGLKRILKDFRNSRQNRPNRVRASHRRLSLFRDFSSSTLHDSKLENQEDIENQAMAVDTVQRENPRRFYITKLLVSPGEDGENERLFFKKLDEQLNKTNNFYKDKVEEVIKEAALLKKQMEAFIALRIKVTNPNFDGSSSPDYVSTDINDLAPSKIIPPGRAETVGVDLSCPAPHSDSHAEYDNPPVENPVGTSVDRENAREGEKAHIEILDRVKILNTCDNPISTIRGVFKDPREKDLSCNKEELKEVEEKLKVAFVEFYQKLCLLKHYSFMNLSAFSKILKKYEKVTCLMERVEVVFAKSFFNSNRRKGMKLLRPKQKIEKHRVTFFSGLFSGCSIALLVAVVLLVEDRELMNKKSATLYLDIIFPLYRRYKINYPFIFGFKQGTELGYREVFLLSNSLAVLALATFLVHLHIKMDSKSQHYEAYIELLPLGLVIVQAIRTFEYYICFYGEGKLPQRLNRCRNHDMYNVFYFIAAVIPYWFRFLQCVRRLFEERDSAHGYNGLRYFLTIVAVIIRTAFELRKKIEWEVLALVSSVIATIGNTYWDIFVDWGLLQRKSKILFLREKSLISHKNVYFVAMVLDILLRFAWLQIVLTLDIRSLRGTAISTIFSCLEILRRGLWNFFRYRAFKSLPLPFTYYDNEDDEDIDKDE
ncbi:putative small molecule transporter [Handroanthus impetiginosus]|uniref:Putative small molecule transporter n=1 Tax=Handroanthus impetiginosus TaxID=429701 RepID=A0A2G9H6Z2_9LAMI|nr:putative small molecule transporter [Handroanthus impetiginosus]